MCEPKFDESVLDTRIIKIEWPPFEETALTREALGKRHSPLKVKIFHPSQIPSAFSQ